MFTLFNTLSKKKEEFHPISKDHVSMYSCGPTVYNYAHIGNFRAYVCNDLLKRYLKYSGFKVMHVMNITDVDDKTIRDSQKEGKSLKEFTEYYTAGFLKDLHTLNIVMPDIMPKATEHVEEMAEIIKTLMQMGIAYKGDDECIYFNIRKFHDYGHLSGVKIEELEENASGRVKNDEYGKENPQDFALWKAWDKGDGEVYWDTVLGKGRPGWHIECSAMSTKYLGETFDIHSGGIDLVFPHHENEIAQSETCFGKHFVNYWFHNEWLLVEGKKMSKSLGNFYSLRDILKMDYDPMAIRYLLLSTHYRTQLNFTFDGLKAAQSVMDKFKEFISKIKEQNGTGHSVTALLDDAEKKFREDMDDDLNISAALAAVFEIMPPINQLMTENKLSKTDAEKILTFLHKINDVLGIMDFSDEKIPEEIQELANQRQQARKDKDFKKSDELRELIKGKGYTIDDTPQGIRIKKI